LFEKSKMVREKMIPIRGIKQDWYGDKEQEVLEKNKEYARRSIKNNLLGSPDFEPYMSFLVKPVEGSDTNRQDTAKKQTKNEKNNLNNNKPRKK
jgi:hypothetical protein